MKTTLLIALMACGMALSGCKVGDRGELGPYEIIPRGREVRLETNSVCELVCADTGTHFIFVARPWQGAKDPQPWLSEYTVVRWVDLDRDGEQDEDEPEDQFGYSGSEVRSMKYFNRRSFMHHDGPQYVEVEYVSNGRTHRVGPRRLP